MCLVTLNDAIELLSDALNSGPSRYEQLVPEIRDVYRAFGFDPCSMSPGKALSALRARKAKGKPR